MELPLIAAGTLIVGYAGYKAYERFGPRRSTRRSGPALRAPSPDKLDYERVTLEAVGVSLLNFIRNTAHLKRLGFRKVADFAVQGWSETYFRGFAHREKPLYALIVEQKGTFPHLELYSIFEDLSAVTTSTREGTPDASRPGSLRFQSLTGLSVDEIYLQHLSAVENLKASGARPLNVSIRDFFPHHEALLVVEHALRKAKRILRSDTLQQAIDAQPDLDLRDLLKRAEHEEAAEAPPPQLIVETSPAPVSEPKLGNSLLAKRLAARQEPALLEPVAVQELEDPPIQVIDLSEEETPIARLAIPAAPHDEDPVRLLLPFENPVDEPVPVRLPFESPDEEVASVRLPFESLEEAPAPMRLPFESVEEVPAPVRLPFENTEAETAPAVAQKPTCPHCGAVLFSSLSSRCSKCKEPVR